MPQLCPLTPPALLNLFHFLRQPRLFLAPGFALMRILLLSPLLMNSGHPLGLNWSGMSLIPQDDDLDALVIGCYGELTLSFLDCNLCPQSSCRF